MSSRENYLTRAEMCFPKSKLFGKIKQFETSKRLDVQTFSTLSNQRHLLSHYNIVGRILVGHETEIKEGIGKIQINLKGKMGLERMNVSGRKAGLSRELSHTPPAGLDAILPFY